MDPTSEINTEYELPLEMQFSMAKAEMQAKELTWDQLYIALMNLFHRRMMEQHAIKSLLAEENIDIDFDVPTELELMQLGLMFDEDEDFGLAA